MAKVETMFTLQHAYRTEFGPEALLELREDMMLAISSLSVGCRNNVLILSSERCLKNVDLNILCSFLSFSYRGKVIIKGVGNNHVGGKGEGELKM